jgi:hypothetical protein
LRLTFLVLLFSIPVELAIGDEMSVGGKRRLGIRSGTSMPAGGQTDLRRLRAPKARAARGGRRSEGTQKQRHKIAAKQDWNIEEAAELQL